MKQLYIKIILLTIYLLGYSQLSASGLVGGQITYKIIDTSLGKYKFWLEVYNNCAAIGLYSGEQLKVNTTSSSFFITLSSPARDEVTPMAYPPDIVTPLASNCPKGPIVNVKGFNRFTFEGEAVIGKNIGWVVVSWSSCCGETTITNINQPNSQGICLQTALNTNYINSSPVHSQPPLLRVPYHRDGMYLLSSYNAYDQQYLNIGGKPILKDSIAYELVPASTNLSANFTLATNYQNPQVTYTLGLSSQNFMHSSKTINIDQKAGILHFKASAQQEVIMTYLVREYRAIPNVNQTAYHRELISYTMRQAYILSNGQELPTEYKGIIKDSSNIDSLVSNNTAKTCAVDNKVVFKVIGSPFQNLKVEDKSFIDPNYIKNYKLNYKKHTGDNVDTLYVTLTFTKIKSSPSLDFMYNIYFVNAGGYKISNYYPIYIQPSSSYIYMPQDTIIMCASAGSIRLNAGIAWGVKWRPLTGLIEAAPDSSWIDVYTPSSRWYYVSNIGNTDGCIINDSVFVRVIACDTIFGKMCIDKDKNCNCDPWELNISNQKIIVKGVGLNYYNEVITDSLGKYWFLVSSWNHYTMESLGKKISCGINNLSQKQFFQMGGNSTFDLPIKDTVIISNLNYGYNDTLLCYGDSLPIDIIFHKSYGLINSIISYGNTVKDTIRHNIDEGYVVINKKHKYQQSGTYISKIVFYNSQYKPVDSIVFHSIKVLNCIRGRVFIDSNANCKFDNYLADKPLPYHYFELKNNGTSIITKLFSDAKGMFKLYFDKLNSYELKNRYTILCNANQKTILIPTYLKDTSYDIEIPIENSAVNYSINLSRKAKVSTDSLCELTLGYSGFFFTDTATKKYAVAIPSNMSFVSSSPNATVIFQNNLYNVSVNYGKTATLQFKFDSVVNTNNYCIVAKLLRIFPEQDTSDNRLTFCLKPNYTSTGTEKTVSIQSQINDIDFTDKSDDLVYQLNFNNNRGSTANQIIISDVLDSNIDKTSVEIMSASHPMNIVWNNNQLFFIFKNIYLPDSSVSDSTSQGFIFFKVRAIAGLKLGDVIKNKAKVKMDFDPEFSTNTTYSKYVANSNPPVSIQSVNNNFNLYPNPTNSNLYIDIPSFHVEKILISTLDGKIVYSSTKQNNIDIHTLSKGIYWIEIKTRMGYIKSKIIKE